MEVHADCDTCGGGISLSPGVDPPPSCPDCGTSLTWHREGFAEDGTLRHCLKCGREDFYAQNQMNPNFGVALVVLGALAFVILVFTIPGMDGFLWGTVVLLSLAVFDRLLRLVLPEVVICYHCATVYEEIDPDQEFEPYDHERAAAIQYGD